MEVARGAHGRDLLLLCDPGRRVGLSVVVRSREHGRTRLIGQSDLEGFRVGSGAV